MISIAEASAAVVEATHTIRRLRAANAELLAIARTFAQYLKQYEAELGKLPDDYVVTVDVGDLRRARQAIIKAEGH